MQFANKEKNSFHWLKLYQLPKKSIYPVLSIFKMYLSPSSELEEGTQTGSTKTWFWSLHFLGIIEVKSEFRFFLCYLLERAWADTDKLRVKIMRQWIRYWSNQIHHPQSFTQTAKYKTYKIWHTWYSDSCLLSKTQLYIKISSPFQICLLNNRIGVSWSQTLPFILIILRSCFPVSNSQEGLTWESYLLVPT